MSLRTIKIVTINRKISVEDFRKTKFIKRLANILNKGTDELVITPLKKRSGKYAFEVVI